MNTQTQPLTFNPEGLEPKTVELLLVIEKLYLEGADIDTDLILKAGAQIGVKKGKYTADMMDGWDYWKWMPKPIIRQSVVKPVKLSELIKLGGKHNCRNTETYNSASITYIGEEIKGMLDNEVYFEIINDCLHVKYERILGGRFIAHIENDIPELN